MNTVEEELEELEIKLNRLKMEYEQYFMGNLRREPSILKGDVQKKIHQFLSQPPTRAREKFRFNTICARYQAYRQLWGRTIREMEAGTHKRFRFKEKLQQQEQAAGGPSPSRNRRKETQAPVPGVDQLYDVLCEARRRTGEGMSGLTPEKLADMVQRQTQQLRHKHGSAKIRFKVVIEGKRAKLRATVVQS
jgi:hypothetical protein